MEVKHYKEELSAFLNQELNKEERQTIGEHLLLCEECRREHDTLKLGVSLAGILPRADAPAAMWAKIEDALDARSAPRMGLMPEASGYSLRKGFAFAAALIAVSALSILVYVNLFSGDSPYVAQHTDIQPPTGNGPGVDIPLPINASAPLPDGNTNIANTNQQPGATDIPSWQVQTIAGSPTVGDGSGSEEIAVGEVLETDARSRARITVADIGSVDISPNSRVKLVGTGKDEHRLSLERGRLHAKIYAPPRLFVVDTPSGKAVDLGCEYTLNVDNEGNSILRVTSGWVALERGGRESIVPAGMMCLTKKGQGLGTPFSAESSVNFKNALERFDFSGGGSGAVQEILRAAEFYDMLTLWHLLSRVELEDRGAVFDALSKFVKPPTRVTREGILSLDKKMLDSWKAEVEAAWFN